MAATIIAPIARVRSAENGLKKETPSGASIAFSRWNGRNTGMRLCRDGMISFASVWELHAQWGSADLIYQFIADRLPARERLVLKLPYFRCGEANCDSQLSTRACSPNGAWDASGLSGSRRCCCARSWQTCSDGRCARRTIDSEMASCRRDTAWSSARYIALAPALCGRMSRLSRFRLWRRWRGVPIDTKKTATKLRYGLDSGPTAISAHSFHFSDFVAADCAFSNRCCVARDDKS